ncbi:MAG: type II toxin-antitoxin system HicA family toxin [Ktedonobacterales bacterium]
MLRNIWQVKSDLMRAGCWWRPGKGSHTVWGHPLVPDVITLLGQGGDDARP